ncbi:MAG: hypothetical protein KDK54_19465 [Leptospiraceae bacterium]|nr:hypothetical protein [Leptospiraceae bacterium]
MESEISNNDLREKFTEDWQWEKYHEWVHRYGKELIDRVVFEVNHLVDDHLEENEIYEREIEDCI